MRVQKEWKPINTTLVVNNIKRIIKTGDIKLLKPATYNFLYLMSGFIAHYNRYGFMDHYEDTQELLRDIAMSSDITRPDYYYEAFFMKDEYSKKYYVSKAKTLIALAEWLRKEHQFTNLT